MDKFKKFNKELLIDINRNSHRYKNIDDDFVSGINLLFGEIDFVRAKVMNGQVDVYTNSTNELFKEITGECEIEINKNKTKYIKTSVDRASYVTAVDIEIKFDPNEQTITNELKTEVTRGLCKYNENSYNKLATRYVNNLKTDLDKYKIFNKDLQLFALCNKLSLTYNFGFKSDDVQKQAMQTKEELKSLDTEITSKLLKGSLVHRMESNARQIERA